MSADIANNKILEYASQIEVAFIARKQILGGALMAAGEMWYVHTTEGSSFSASTPQELLAETLDPEIVHDSFISEAGAIIAFIPIAQKETGRSYHEILSIMVERVSAARAAAPAMRRIASLPQAQVGVFTREIMNLVESDTPVQEVREAARKTRRQASGDNAPGWFTRIEAPGDMEVVMIYTARETAAKLRLGQKLNEVEMAPDGVIRTLKEIFPKTTTKTTKGE